MNQLEAWLWLDGPTAREGRVEGPARELFLAMNAKALAAAPTGDEIELPSAWDRLDEITVPTLVLLGELDLEDIAQNNEAFAERIPDATFEELADTAHVPHLEGHARCREAIRGFLA